MQMFTDTGMSFYSSTSFHNQLFKIKFDLLFDESKCQLEMLLYQNYYYHYHVGGFVNTDPSSLLTCSLDWQISLTSTKESLMSAVNSLKFSSNLWLD